MIGSGGLLVSSGKDATENGAQTSSIPRREDDNLPTFRDPTQSFMLSIYPCLAPCESAYILYPVLPFRCLTVHCRYMDGRSRQKKEKMLHKTVSIRLETRR